MNTLTNAPIQLKITGAVLAIAALVVALLAVTMTVGPTLAQTDPYPDPKPCGPGQHGVPDSPDATITSGHYAVFDGYWDFDDKTLELNLCPPSVVHTTETQTIGRKKVEVEVSTRAASNVDIQQTVFHINGSDFEHTLTAADVETYDFFKLHEDEDTDGVDDAVGKTVWWLKVDDPDTADVDEDSALAMGFSAALFDSQYWYLDDGVQSAEGLKPLQYEFEVIREPGIPVDEQGHVFAFDDSDPPSADIPKTAYWDSSAVDANALPLYPGDYHHFQWAFTRAGTYVISVQLKGHVRTTDDPAPDGADADWKPISDQNIVTSEVKQYVFQIGALDLNHEPAFVVERSVEENSATDTLVGDPIAVYQGDEDPLTYTLTGPGHSLFNVEADANGNAQIKVSDQGGLDYEVRSLYRLTLGVSDNKDHESNADTAVDSVISVRIDVTDLLEVEENSVADTPVGAPIEVEDAGTNTLAYTLSGDGHDLFTVERDATTGNAQIKVSGQGVLDYEARSSYQLDLNVTGYADPSRDHTISVKIAVTDQVERSVPENSAADTLVGTPIEVQDAGTNTLAYTLSGDGHDLFTVERDATTGNAQIKVSGQGVLDYEVRSSYQLDLDVTGYADPSRDHTISFNIAVTDQPEAERSVDENSAEDTLVGDAIAVANADATTVYTLSGHGHGLFSVERDSSNNAQIKVAADAVINYEDASSYILTLHADTAGTEHVRVTINVTDDPDEQLAITLTAAPSGHTHTVGTSVVFTGTVTGSPVPTSQLLLGWGEQDQGGGNAESENIHSLTRTVTGGRVAIREYNMRVWYSGVAAVESNQIVITWQARQ